MRFIRFYDRKEAAIKTGWIHDQWVGEIQGDMFTEYRRLEAKTPLENVKLLAPVKPGKIVGIGWNYVDHAKELDRPLPEVPTVFLKPTSAVIGSGDGIILPPVSEQVEHEGELAVVIGRQAKNVLAETAKTYIFGYTIGNDVTARDLQRKDDTWTRAKGFDTFCPLGPWIETEFEPSDAMLSCSVNSSIRQMASTRDMIFPVTSLIAYVSSIMTLEPGDVILTGTPAGTSKLEIGNSIEVAIDGIGRLVNPVVSYQTD